MTRHRCTWCGYEYDAAAGDPEHGIPPGTAFDDLPAAWICPDCRAPKSDFTVRDDRPAGRPSAPDE
ncbi:MAG: rubredoxin [Casimicrobiaceae bacterium]